MRFMLLVVVTFTGLVTVPVLRADETDYQRRQRLLDEEWHRKKNEEYRNRLLKQDAERIRRRYAVRYAAIAYSPRTGKYGYTYNYLTLNGARQEALRQCRADDGKVVTWASAGRYCALAVGEEGSYGYAGGKTAAEAKAAALAQCRKLTPRCRIVVCVKSGG